MINFAVLTVFGVLLRCLQLYDLPFLDYQYILHAHSHFAFAGWMFFAIALLLAQTITGGQHTPGFKYMFIAGLISAYGMLISFSLQGYQLVPIIFSTLFVVVTYRFTYLALQGTTLKDAVSEIGFKLIKGALIFLCLSSLGPFAVGPLAALGLKNSPYYQDAIYFYLHFQMNGFMFLGSLGLLAAASLTKPLSKHSMVWLDLFIYSTIPLYFIFTLWDKPNGTIGMLASLGSGLNLLSWIMLGLNFRKNFSQFSFLVKAAMVAATLKIVFQVLVCVPFIGNWTFLNRNLIIGYIHLLTLGIIMPIIIDQFISKGFLKAGKLLTITNWFYLLCVILYLTLLFIQPLLTLFSVTIPHYQLVLFLLCFLFLPVSLLLFGRIKNQEHIEA